MRKEPGVRAVRIIVLKTSFAVSVRINFCLSKYIHKFTVHQLQLDCGGKECMNGGKLDPGTCKCTCKGFWQGDKCETRKLLKL